MLPKNLLLLCLAALAACKGQPYETRKDVRRKAFAAYTCALGGGRQLSLTLSSEPVSCKEVRTRPYVVIALDARKDSPPKAGVPLAFGGTEQTRSLRCDGNDCNPVWGALTLSTFKPARRVAGSYEFQWANGSETGAFSESQWCPDEPACE